MSPLRSLLRCTLFSAALLLSALPAPAIPSLLNHKGSTTAGSGPSAEVSLPVVKGLYSVLLGDTALVSRWRQPPV